MTFAPNFIIFEPLVSAFYDFSKQKKNEITLDSLVFCALLCLLYSSLWLPSSFACYTAAFGCLQDLLVIQQPLAAFKLCLIYSSLWQPSSFACYTAAFGCLPALLVIQQPLAAFQFNSIQTTLLSQKNVKLITTSGDKQFSIKMTW